MTKPIARDPIYRKRAFDADIIELCVRWYITYRLSYRDLVEMMAERGVQVAHSTILRWVTVSPLIWGSYSTNPTMTTMTIPIGHT